MVAKPIRPRRATGIAKWVRYLIFWYKHIIGC